MALTKEKIKLLAIETSCDETAAAIVEFNQGDASTLSVVSSVVASQINLHKKYGGVFPELASRAHSQKILPVYKEALRVTSKQANRRKSTKGDSYLPPATCHLSLNDIDALAVTAGPGLIGSLIVGVEFVRGLASASNKPVIALNHLEGHIFASFINENTKIEEPTYPALALVVSGGHTLLVLLKNNLEREIIGTTVDDAAGEAFDKIARMLGLPYPGGPALSKLAESGNPGAYDFPRSMLHSGDNNFSFSGLKTSVFYKLRSLGMVDNKAEPVANAKIDDIDKVRADIAAAAQTAIVDVLVSKAIAAARQHKVRSLLVGGGVAANTLLRKKISHTAKQNNIKVHLSPVNLSTDNALSMAIAGAYHYVNGDVTSWQNIDANASLQLK